ncbi:hypothetical protein BJV78DRAFT_195755 [Lactifluus subvellereus]|nr:hypothetical protein BJV78DRAFT_195755 [Lactifluus subvellereus]
MSRPSHQVVNLGGPPEMGVGTDHPPQSAPQNQASQALLSMYMEIAGEEDKKMADSWKGDADGILIFTGLFSAAVAALVAISIQDLRPSSQDTSTFYLAKIYQLQADANRSPVSIPSTLPDPSTPFSPPNYAVWVNSLWLLSLVISLTCALLATLLQQWARRYIKAAQARDSDSLQHRARIRAFFAEGVDKLHFPWVVEALPTLLHLSLSLFFAGLVIFLFNINHTVFKVVISWVGICATIYICITFMPILRHDSPYYSPLSSSVWFLYSCMLCVIFRILLWVVQIGFFSSETQDSVEDSWDTCRGWLLQGAAKAAEETARNASRLGGRGLAWTLECLHEDHELERFFAGIPGFCSSEVVGDLPRNLAKLDSERTVNRFVWLLNHTWSSDLVSKTVRHKRFIICVKAADAAHLSHAVSTILYGTFSGTWDGVLQSVEIGHSLRSTRNGTDRDDGLCAQGVVAGIITSVQERDDRWIALAMDQLGVSEDVLRDYLTHGDSVLLVNLLHITRQFFHSYHEGDRRVADFMAAALSFIIPAISKFDYQNTLPGLQHDFCALWNEIILEARDRGILKHILHLITLRSLRHAYIALHQGTDAAPSKFSTSTGDDESVLYDISSYPLCTISEHCSDSTSHIHEVVDRTTGETSHAPIASPPTVPHHDTVLATTTPARPDAPDVVLAFPMPSPVHAGPHPADHSELLLGEVPDA